MALHNMAVQQCLHGDALFQVHNLALFQLTYITFYKRFLYGSYPIPVFFYFFNCEAYAVVAQALVYMKPGRQIAFYPEGFIRTFSKGFNYRSKVFYNAAKHAAKVEL